jgi:hypothetical protein
MEKMIDSNKTEMRYLEFSGNNLTLKGPAQ